MQSKRAAVATTEELKFILKKYSIIGDNRVQSLKLNFYVSQLFTTQKLHSV